MPSLAGKFPTLNIGGPAHLARVVGMPLERLRGIAEHAHRYYRPFDKIKPDGSVRPIDRPVGHLKRVQKRINERILAPAINSAIAYGSIRGRRVLAVPKVHAAQAALGVVDIQSFFPSVTNDQVFGLLRRMGVDPRTASLMTKLLTYERRLPQGSPASPSVANLLLSGLDDSLTRRAQRAGIRATRIMDDIQVSGPRRQVKGAVELVVKEVHRLGLRVHRRKTSFTTNDRPQVVMNVHVNTKPSVPRARAASRRSGLAWDELRAAVKKAEAGATAEELASLHGKLRYAAEFNETRAKRLADRLMRVSVSG